MNPHFEAVSHFPFIAPNSNVVRLCGFQAASSLTVPIAPGDPEIQSCQPTGDSISALSGIPKILYLMPLTCGT
jgi:hypothetical protein